LRSNRWKRRGRLEKDGRPGESHAIDFDYEQSKQMQLRIQCEKERLKVQNHVFSRYTSLVKIEEKKR